MRISFKTPSVKTVYQEFIAKLDYVIEYQEKKVINSLQKQELLTSALETAQEQQVLAEKEVKLANKAIKNIGVLLGVETNESGEEDHF